MSAPHRSSRRSHGRAAVWAAVAASLLLGTRASATPTGVTFSSITPSDGTTLFVARTAANDPLDPPTFQLKADVFFNNFSGAEVEVTKVTFRYPGSSIPETVNTPLKFLDMDNDKVNETIVNWTLPPGPGMPVGIHHGLINDLPTPLPATVEIDFEFDDDGDPLTLTFDLAFYENAVPLKAHFFPARAEDLDLGEVWFWSTRHSVDSGGGVGGLINPSTQTQRYALDMGVVAWNGSGWDETFDGTRESNEDFRQWEKPLYAMGDGTIVACYRGEPDEPPNDFDSITFKFGFGNSLFIRYGDDLVSIGHMQDGSIPEALCPTPSSPGPGLWPDMNNQDGLSIPVTAGQFLGRVGNTGRSTNPHIHFQVEGAATGNTVQGGPMQFVNVRVLADDTNVNNLGDAPVLRPLNGMTLHRNTLVLPNPCGYDLPAEGFLEVSRHGVSLECYQDVFNMMVARGYAPKFVDAYDVDGETFVNATFHPFDVPYVAKHGLTSDEYQALFDDLTAADDGWRLQQIDAYLDGGNVRYAVLFEQWPGHPFAAFHGLNDAEYVAQADALKNDGYVPVNISAVEVGGSLYWTGLFEQANVTGFAVETVPAADYQDTFDTNEAAGRLPIYVHGISRDEGPYLTGIWVDPVGGSWAAVHGRTGAEYQVEWDTHTGAGLFTRSTTGYDDGSGSALYAAVWRGRPSTSITDTPDDPTNQTSAGFGLASGNPFATFECRLDGGAFAACASPKNYAGLSEGTHTFDVRAFDRERVVDLSPASFTWLVDVTPPEVALVAPVAGTKTINGVLKSEPVTETTIVGWGTVTAHATDNLSGVATVVFKVDGVPVPGGLVTHAGDNWSFVFEPNQKNLHTYTIQVVATDHAGNSASASMPIIGIKTIKKM